MSEPIVVIIGGTSGICKELAASYAADGRHVVIYGRDGRRASIAAEEIAGPGQVSGRALDLAEPTRIAERLADFGSVDRLVLGASERDDDTVADYDVARALQLITLKLVGYTEVVHALRPRLTKSSAVLLFGGNAFQRPYPGSTTVTTINGGVTGLVRTLAVELAPVRVNGIHPGIVGDSPFWSDVPSAVLDPVRAQTPLGRLVTMAEIVHASRFLLENGGVTGVNLQVDGGSLLL
jgi:NAD(P)-dependent dehydrogenase (short-subunit alcohol dehydrogenase family)